ncbi:type I methionyl aminopeptidase [Candidatus Chlorohelix sp.]|uniref:type I methionyl aminopeptidase n=1 Tax=Candidatus Chlorohelix sp. TaxID=3139201 RepID=UPI003031E482
MVICKTKAEIAEMREAGRIAGHTLDVLEKNIRPGITANELDKIAEETIRSQGGTPTFKGYDPGQRGYDPKFRGYNGYPSTICISFNEEIVHGIPSKRALKEGDIIGIDIGATYKDWVGDTARTFMVGKVSDEARKLVEVTEQSLHIAIEKMRLGNYLFDISNAIADYVDKFGYGIVRDYCGHGVGHRMHEDPNVPHNRQQTRGMALRRGMVLAIEPMINLGTHQTRVKPDKWTVVTADGSLSAHFEHTIAITDGDPIVLTLPE